jgi:DNA sulfur modification protein DndD
LKLLQFDLENYRQFRGIQSISLSNNDEKNVNIILGDMGSGKTNILNAINWCLFGDEPGLRTTKGSDESIANIKEFEENKSVKVRVKLIFGNSTPEYIFERYCIIEGTPKNPIISSEGWSASSNVNGNWETNEGNNCSKMTEFNILRDEIVPESIRNFFFFDGEKLDKFFYPGYQRRVHEAITSVCQIELLDRTISHLESKEDEFRKKIKGQSTQVNEISTNIDKLGINIEKKRGEIKKIKSNIEEAEINKIDLENKLRDFGHKDAEVLAFERNQLKSSLEKTQKSIEVQEKKKVDEFSSYFIYALSLPLVKKALNLIEFEKKTSTTIPIPVNVGEKFLSDLLRNKTCVCGTPLAEGSKNRNSVEEFLRNLPATSKISEEATEGYYKIEPLIKKGLKFEDLRIEIEKELSHLKSEYEKVDERLKEISKKISGIPIDEIKNMEDKIQMFESAINDENRSLGFREAELIQFTKQLDAKKKELEQELRKDKKMSEMRKRIALCNHSLEILRKLKDNVTEKVRDQVERKTKEYFFQFHWKKDKDAFKNLTINEKYEVSVIGSADRDLVNYLSSGEGQTLALSFMAALSSVSGFETPVLIDTPLGRISGKPKENIAQFLPKYLEKSQLTLLCTDQEYTEKVKKAMTQRIGKEFTLNYDGYEGKTTIQGN